jgi:hypothetical protein
VAVGAGVAARAGLAARAGRATTADVLFFFFFPDVAII